MKNPIGNVIYSLVALGALGFALYVPSLARVAAASPVSREFSQGTEIRGYVVGVGSGDTLKLLTAERRELRIRLAGINAPEKGQAYSEASKRSLSDLTYSKPALVQVVAAERHGQIDGRVYIGTLDVNVAQVGRGMAWADAKAATDTYISTLEGKARRARIGLWADQREPVAPWDFRQQNEAGTASR